MTVEENKINETPAPIVAPEVTGTVNMTSDALKQRLASERARGEAELLKSLGFKDLDEAKRKAEEAEALRKASLSETDRLKEEAKQAEQLRVKLDGESAQSKALLARVLKSVPEATREKIMEKSGGDPAKALEMIELLETMQSETPAAPATPVLANTPGTQQPPPANSGSPKSPREIYLEKSVSDPIAAQIYAQMNPKALQE